jgi:Ca2+-binding RTX toxin-like protein
MASKPHPPIESLEPRQLFSIADGAGHILSVHGAGGFPNSITVGLMAGGQAVYATVSYTTPKKTVTQTKTFPLARVRLLIIDGGNKADTILIDQTNGLFPRQAVIRTHNGNDVVYGGDEQDKVILGTGNDLVNSGNGNDNLYAGRGLDTLLGGDGNDIFHGGRGPDDIEAGNGNNTLVDPVGYDTLLAGSGHDTFIVKSIALNPDNNYDPSKDTLVKYVPPSTNDNNNLGQTILNDLLDSYLF